MLVFEERYFKLIYSGAMVFKLIPYTCYFTLTEAA